MTVRVRVNVLCSFVCFILEDLLAMLLRQDEFVKSAPVFIMLSSDSSPQGTLDMMLTLEDTSLMVSFFFFNCLCAVMNVNVCHTYCHDVTIVV